MFSGTAAILGMQFTLWSADHRTNDLKNKHFSVAANFIGLGMILMEPG
jgi:hypothetical protein